MRSCATRVLLVQLQVGETEGKSRDREGQGPMGSGASKRKQAAASKPAAGTAVASAPKPTEGVSDRRPEPQIFQAEERRDRRGRDANTSKSGSGGAAGGGHRRQGSHSPMPVPAGEGQGASPQPKRESAAAAALPASPKEGEDAPPGATDGEGTVGNRSTEADIATPFRSLILVQQATEARLSGLPLQNRSKSACSPSHSDSDKLLNQPIGRHSRRISLSEIKDSFGEDGESSRKSDSPSLESLKNGTNSISKPRLPTSSGNLLAPSPTGRRRRSSVSGSPVGGHRRRASMSPASPGDPNR